MYWFSAEQFFSMPSKEYCILLAIDFIDTIFPMLSNYAA